MSGSFSERQERTRNGRGRGSRHHNEDSRILRRQEQDNLIDLLL